MSGEFFFWYVLPLVVAAGVWLVILAVDPDKPSKNLRR